MSCAVFFAIFLEKSSWPTLSNCVSLEMCEQFLMNCPPFVAGVECLSNIILLSDMVKFHISSLVGTISNDKEIAENHRKNFGKTHVNGPLIMDGMQDKIHVYPRNLK